MAIPTLNEQGWLPAGIHDCTLEEIKAIFGTFRRSEQRIRLTERLAEYIDMARRSGVGQDLYVDGSYVTDKEEPGDIDVLLILRDDIALDATVPPVEYNARSGKFVRRKFGFDFFFGFYGDATSEKMLSFFRRVKGRPNAEKGLLRIKL